MRRQHPPKRHNLPNLTTDAAGNVHGGAAENLHGTTVADFHCQAATLDGLPDGALTAMLPRPVS
jgi:hypothetical protein